MKRRAFTLVEMLVVIGIIVVLVGLLAPMVTRAWKVGDRARTAADLAAIATALEAYKQDHGEYPHLVTVWSGDRGTYTGPAVLGPPYAGAPADYNGARLLCRALIAPGPGVSTNPQQIPDGKGESPTPGAPETLNSPGFRIRAGQGKVYGPYLKPESFKIGDPTTPGSTVVGRWAILDKSGRPILYYPATPNRPNVSTAAAYISDQVRDPFLPATALYYGRDNWDGNATNAARVMGTRKLRRMLGDLNNNGGIDGAEQAVYTGPFILWAAGPDEEFGSEAPNGRLDKTDDVTNFRQ